jgi:hypothetical protein
MNYGQHESGVRRLMGNAFGVPRGHFYAVAAYLPAQCRRRPGAGAGAQAAYLIAAAVRTLTQGEG